MFLTVRSAYVQREKSSLYININRFQISTTVRLYVHFRQ